jgi:hypothetical protein
MTVKKKKTTPSGKADLIRQAELNCMAELIRTGALRPATKRVSMKLLRAKPPTSRESIVETLLEERREGR